MTRIITVEPGLTTVVASGPQYGVKFVLTGTQGSGVRVTFNDPEDADNIGWLTNVTGLDSPDVRESADDLIGDDGGIHGDFWHGRRPIVLEGQIDNTPHFVMGDVTPTAARNIRMTKLQRVTNALRKDMTMRWMPEGGIQQVVYLRRQQPLRIQGSYNKTFQASLVAADPRIYSAEIKEARFFPGVQGQTIVHEGTMRTQPVATIIGPSTGSMTGIEVRNQSTGETSVLAPSYALASGQYIVLDFANKTMLREDGTNIYDKLVFPSSSWWQVEPGDNEIRLIGTGTTTNASLILRWQDAWI